MTQTLPTNVLWNGDIFPMAELLEGNSHDEDVMRDLTSLQPGQTIQFGGGAAALMTIQAPSFVYHTLTVFLDDTGGYYRVKAYRGRATKPLAFYRYSTVAQRDNFIERLKADEDRREEIRQARKSVPNSFQLGDILHYSWGYDQTQCEFYQVVGLTPRGIKIRRVEAMIMTGSGSSNGMSDRRMPVKDNFIGEVLSKVVKSDDAVKMDCGYARKWDGQAKYCSWYA